jgi:hypothetical protein
MQSFDQKYPSLETFAAGVAAVAGKIEVIKQDLYDRITYPHLGLNNFTFFSQPIGSGFSSESGSGAVGKTLADTNMTQNGQLPAPQAFWVEGIECWFDPGSTVAGVNDFTTINPSIVAAAQAVASAVGVSDKNLVENAGSLTFSIGQKPYLYGAPLLNFLPRAQRRVDGSQCNGAVAANAMFTGVAWTLGEPYKLDPGMGIPTGMNFGVNVNFPVLQPTTTNNGRLNCKLPGWLFRAAQ